MKNGNGINYTIDNEQNFEKLNNSKKYIYEKNKKYNNKKNEKLVNENNSFDYLNELKLTSFDTLKHINFFQNKKFNLKENSSDCQKSYYKKNDIEANDYKDFIINEKNIPHDHLKNREILCKKMNEKTQLANFSKENNIEEPNKNSKTYSNFNKKNVLTTIFQEKDLSFKNNSTQNYSFSKFSTNKLNPCETFLNNLSNNENYIVYNENDEMKNQMSTLIYNRSKNPFEDKNKVEENNLQIKNMNTYDTNKENYYKRNDDKIYLKQDDLENGYMNNDNFNNYAFLNLENKIYSNEKNGVMVHSDNMINENILNKTGEIPIINKNRLSKKIVNSNNYIIEKNEEKNNVNYSQKNFLINNINTPKNYFFNNKKDCNKNDYIFYKNNMWNDKIENDFIDQYKINNKNGNYSESDNSKIPYDNSSNSNKINNNINKCYMINSNLNNQNVNNNNKTYFLKNDIIDKINYNMQEDNNDTFIKSNIMNNMNAVDNLKLMNCDNTEYNNISNNYLNKYNCNVNNYNNNNNIYSIYGTYMSPNYNFTNDDNNVNNLHTNNDSINGFSYVNCDRNCHIGDNYENNIYINDNSSTKNEHYINKNFTSNNNNNNNNYTNNESINTSEHNKNDCFIVNSVSNLNYVNDKNEEIRKNNISYKKENEYVEYKFPNLTMDNRSYNKKCYNMFSKNNLITKHKEFMDSNYSSPIRNNKEQDIRINNINYNSFINDNNYIENNKTQLKKTEIDTNYLNGEKENIDRFCNILLNEEKRAANNSEINHNKNIEVPSKNDNISNTFKNFTNDNETIKHILYNEKINSKYSEATNSRMNDNGRLNNLRNDDLENDFNNFDIQYINYKKKNDAIINEINKNTQPSFKKKEYFTNEFQKNKKNEENINELSGNREFPYEEIENINNSEMLYNLKNKNIDNSFELSLFDNTNELNNKYEDLFEKKMIYNLYLQSLLANINNSYKNENSPPKNNDSVKNDVNDQLILFNLNNVQNKILNKIPRINSYFSYLDYYIESLRLLYDKLLSNRSLILKLAKEIFSKNINEKKIYNSLDDRHSYFRELLSILLPQPPVFPSLEVWLYMDKKNASQIHKLHLTLYIIYQKIIYNFSNILLQINNDINYSNKNKSSKNNETDSINYYIDYNQEKDSDAFKNSLKSDYISKDSIDIEEGITNKNLHINELKSNDSKILVPSSNNKIMKYNDIDANYKNNKIEKKCLFEINRKLENIMNSINNITNMINRKKESTLENKRNLRDSGIIDDKKRCSIETIEDNMELSNNKLYEKEYDHDNNFMHDIKKESSPKYVCNINEGERNYTFNNQIVAYDDLKNDELFENISNIKLDRNNLVYEENTLKLLDKIKYELNDIYNEIFNLNKYDNLVSLDDQSNNFSRLWNSNSNDTISNTKPKLKSYYFNGLLDSEDLNYNQLNDSSSNYNNFSNNKSLNKKDYNIQNKLMKNIENTNLSSNQNINDIIYDINCTDDIFKRLILSKNYYNNLSDYDSYLINAYKENEKKFKNFNEIKNSNNMGEESFCNQLLPSNEKSHIFLNNNNVNIYNKDNNEKFITNMNNSLFCDTSGKVNVYINEKENDNSNKSNENSFIFTNNENNSNNNNDDFEKESDYINMNLYNFKNSFENLSLDNKNDIIETNNSLVLSGKNKNNIILNKKKNIFLSDNISKNKKTSPLNEYVYGYIKDNDITNYNTTFATTSNDNNNMDNSSNKDNISNNNNMDNSSNNNNSNNKDNISSNNNNYNDNSSNNNYNNNNKDNISNNNNNKDDINNKDNSYNSNNNNNNDNSCYSYNSNNNYNSCDNNNNNNSNNNNCNSNNINNDNINILIENVENEMMIPEVKYTTDHCTNNEKLNYNYFFLKPNNSDNLLMKRKNDNSETPIHELSNFFSKNMNNYSNNNSLETNVSISENLFESPKIKHDISETTKIEENNYFGKLKGKNNNSYINNQNEKIDDHLTYLQNNFGLNENEENKNSLSIIKNQENYDHIGDITPSNFANSQNILTNDSLNYDINSHKNNIIINNNVENNNINNHLNDSILSNDHISNTLMMDNNSNLIMDTNINNSNNSLLNRNILSNDIVNNSTINRSIINFNTESYNKIDDNIINNHLINDNVNYYNNSSHLLNYNNLKNDLENDLENNIYNSQIIENKFIDNEVPNNKLLNNEFGDKENLKINILCDDNLNSCINFHKSDFEKFNGSSLENEEFINVNNNNYKSKLKTNDIKDFSENVMENKRKYNFSNDENLIEDVTSEIITKSHSRNSNHISKNLSATELWKYEKDHSKQLNETKYDEKSKKEISNIAEIKDIENEDKINNVNKIKLKKMLEITDKLIGKKYRGISYDPTRNGWSTFVYKDGVRHKKFFSSFKYGNLLAKKKSIEWRLKNLNPDSHAYAFSLQAKEEFNAILNNDYEEMNTTNDKKKKDNSDNINRDILYINAFLNLFNDEKEKKYSSDESNKIKKSKSNEVKGISKKRNKKNINENNCNSSNRKNMNIPINYDTNNSCSLDNNDNLNDKNTKNTNKNKFLNKKKNYQNKNKQNKKKKCSNNYEHKKNKKEKDMNLQKKNFLDKFHPKNNLESFSDIDKLQNDNVLLENINENSNIEKGKNSFNLKKTDQDDSFLNKKHFLSFLNQKELNSKSSDYNENKITKKSNKENYKNVIDIYTRKKKKGKINKINEPYDDLVSSENFNETRSYDRLEKENSSNNDKNDNMNLRSLSDDISSSNSKGILMNAKNNSFIKYKNKKKRKRNSTDGNESVSDVDILHKSDIMDENSLIKENELFNKIYSLCENGSIDDDAILEKIEKFYDDDYLNKNYISGDSKAINENNAIDSEYLMENFHLEDKNKLLNKMEVNNLKKENNMISEDNYFKENCLMNDNDALTEVDTVDEEEIISNFYSLGINDSIKENFWTKEMNLMNDMNSIEDNEFISKTKESKENKVTDIEKDKTNENIQKKRNIPNEKVINDSDENDNKNKIDSYFSIDHNRNNNNMNENSFKYADELSEEKKNIYVGNKNVNDQNYYIYKDKLLKYMSECSCTTEEEKNVFIKYLNLKTGWILLELSDLEETYHDYFRSKIESFYKSYLLKVKNNNRKNENIGELQIIFEKKLNTPWKHMIFPLYFLYIFNYKIFSILKRTKKKANITNDVNERHLKSNIRGINYIKYKKSWCFTYIDIDEKKKKKCFSILQYGFMESKALAILYRKSFVSHLTKMQNFIKNVIFKNKLTTINKLNNYKTIYDYIDYYKKYEEFLVCYGKIIYFNEMKYIYLSSRNKQNALNYLPFEVHNKLSNEIEPINLITATRNYFSKKSKLLKFPKGVVYLSGYFLWAVLFLNKNNKEIIVSFSVRKYSFENARARCIECYYCLLYKYKFHPVNISGVIDLVLESDIECKSYNLLDYSSEELISLEYLFHYFSPSNYIIKNDIVYKKISYIEKDLHKEYDQMFPNEYVHLDNYQSYEMQDKYLYSELYMNKECNFFSNSCNSTSIRDDNIYINNSKVDQNIFNENIDSQIYLDKNCTLNSSRGGNDKDICDKKFSNNNSCDSSFENLSNINNDSSNNDISTYKYEINNENEIKNEKEENLDSYILRDHSNTFSDLLTIRKKKCDKKNIPLYFTDDEKNKTIYRNNSHNEGKNYNFTYPTQNEKTKKEETNFSNTKDFIDKGNISQLKTHENYNDLSENKNSICSNENSNESEKRSSLNHNNKKFNDSITSHMCTKQINNMLVENINDDNTNKNNSNTFSHSDVYINCVNKMNDNDKYNFEEKNISFEKKKYNELKEEVNQEQRNIFHLNDYKENDVNNSVDEDNLEKKNDSEHFFNKENNFYQECKNSNRSFLNQDYYKKILSKSIYNFFDNNLQDEYLKKKYDELFNENEVKTNIFKKIDKKEEHLGIFMLLNCQWLSDSFVNNIYEIEMKYADIYSFENYRNTREEVLKWKCKKNFIKECSEISKKFPRKVGVHYDSYAHAWVVNCSFNGRRHDKKFLVKTFGFLQARKLAIEYREKWMQLKSFHRMKNLKKKIKNKKNK
ncbi:transcription factor with AP2 domain(s), putative [Plasmodium gallinaceum]|uniref:Transcription factor with AP2 domain(S), putative n=1 Tax=Plasmodium gallinaceum TaxID=5849 RepID=A0A1J1GRH3_PLAGA|nr:transcription factor with AP2 domain(s), putative [Plasmodium gallinaceum]CRG95135.1 transcription factor with AP2 domain(s), putative [Plasmodium gallinaceum]